MIVETRHFRRPTIGIQFREKHLSKEYFGPYETAAVILRIAATKDNRLLQKGVVECGRRQ